MGLHATIFTSAPEPEQLCDISEHWTLHMRFCSLASTPVYPGYDDVYLSDEVLDTVAAGIAAEMKAAGIAPLAEGIEVLPEGLDVDAEEDPDGCLPHYLRLVEELQAIVDEEGWLIYSASS